MSKNLTRKGLALGAVVALGSTLFAGTPASAAELLTLAPSAGTTYNTLSTSTFTLATGFGTVGSNYGNLKYRVTNSSQAQIRADVESDGTGAADILTADALASTAANSAATAQYSITDWSYDEIATTGTDDTVTFVLAAGHGIVTGDRIKITGFAGTDDGTATTVATAVGVAVNGKEFVATVSTNNITITPASATLDTAGTADLAAAGATATAGTIGNRSVSNAAAFVVNPVGLGNAGAIGVTNVLKLSTTAYAADTALTVQSWIDTDGNNVINDGESTSPIRTVTFKNVANLTGAVSLVSPFIGDTSVAATVTLSGDINYQQISAGDVKVNFTGDSTSDATANASAQNAAWDSVKGDFRASASYTVAAAELFRAQLYVDNNNGGTVAVGAPDLEGAASNATASAAGTAYSVLVKAVNAAGVKNTASNTADGSTDNWLIDAAAVGNVNGTAVVKTDARKVTVSFFVGTDVAAPIGVSDVPVRAVVSTTDVELDDAVTVAGSSLYTGQSRTVNLTTGTAGLVTLEIDGAKADDTETVVITTSVAGTSAGTYTITFNDSVYGATALNNESVRSIKAADTYSLEYKVVDQWGILPANSAYRVWVEDAENEGRTTAADFLYSGDVVDGIAKVSVKDNGVGTGSYKAVASLATNGSTTAIGSTISTSIKVVTDITPSTVTLKTLTYGALQAEDKDNDGDYTSTGDVDNTAKLIVETATLANYDARYAIPGATAPAVTAGNKVVIAGTVKNAGATAVAGTPVTVAAKGFLFLGASRYFTDSIVVYTGTDGTFSVDAWSNVGGSQTVTVTAGSAVASQALKFAPGLASGKTVVFAPKGVSAAGRTIDLSSVISDKYGNPAKGVVVTYAATGAGYLSANTATTDSTGTATVKLITLAGDFGLAKVTATYTDVDGKEVVTSRDIYVGVKATIAKAKNSVATVKNAAGATITVVRGTKSKTVIATSNSQKVTVKGGTGTVKVYVNDTKVASK
jgi:hypothetical protein